MTPSPTPGPLSRLAQRLGRLFAPHRQAAAAFEAADEPMFLTDAGFDLVTASGNTLRFSSVTYGSDATAQIEVNSGTFAFTGGDSSGLDNGTDGEATST